MQVTNFNVNGIRACCKKGFLQWLQQHDADVLCLQEVRALPEQLPPELKQLPGWWAQYVPAVKKGYSGVAILSKKPPDNIITGLGWEGADNEGRFVQADFGDTSVVSLYMPSGSSSSERQQAKYYFMERFLPILQQMQQSGRKYIIAGDWNIAHREIDLCNWKSNMKNSGFLPEERAWLDRLFDEVGLIDAYRKVEQSPSQYTWWSNRGRARANNVGWRIDYQVVSSNLSEAIEAARIDGNRNMSDHAPVSISYKIKF
ncbi:MAG: exodeoxyribonuclease III [Candidatus Porifericomitaceae bacterium WSBS_2022_MAG_OTU9]